MSTDAARAAAGSRAGRGGDGSALRKDAEQNRQRLLGAARELFAERGQDVTLHEVAARAGVGVGTAYRRFANKGLLMDALFGLQIQELSEVTDRALADPDPWQGLVTYLEQAMALQAKDRALAQFLSGSRVRPEQHDWSRDTLAPKVNAITERAKQAGLLRPDVDGTDLIFVQAALNAVMDRTRDQAPDLYRRYLAIVLDGLRAHPARTSKLPVPALSVAETHAAMGPPEQGDPPPRDPSD